MGVQTIIELIEREAEDEVAGILAGAERASAQLLAQADAHVAARVAEALDRHAAEIRAESQRRVNTVRLRVLEERARLDAERVGTVFEAAEARIQAITDAATGTDTARWSAALVTLAEDALEAVGQGARLTTRRRDAASLAALIAAWGVELKTVDDSEPAGVSVISADGRVEIDARLSVRQARARTVLAESIAETLALRPGELVV